MSKAYLNRGYEYTPISMGYSLDSPLMQAAGSKKDERRGRQAPPGRQMMASIFCSFVP